MVISRTPFRISFFGGGTDYPAWYKENPGAVLAASIDKYCYITCGYLPPFFDYKYRILYSRQEVVNKISEIQHPTVRETLRFFNLRRGISIQHIADLPARSGMGSSSSFTVGLLNALYALKGKIVSKKQLALEAIDIEQNWTKENIGSQDQITVAFGGFNKIEFKPGKNNIELTPITIDPKKIRFFQSHLALFFTGFSRTATEITGEQINNIPEKKKELKAMYEMVYEAISILNSRASLDAFGKLLHQNWKIKRTLSNKITNPRIDEIYESARRAGAIGGKILGAGGGGFILFFVKPELQHRVKEKLKKLLYVPFKFEELGSQVIYYRPDLIIK
jgi:D-glycero-alpha-D-manno-heptose-7-phosphate kinase